MEEEIKQKLYAIEQTEKEEMEEKRLRDFALAHQICPECGNESPEYIFIRSWDWGSDEYEINCQDCGFSTTYFK